VSSLLLLVSFFVDLTQIIDIYFYVIGQAKAIQTYKNHQLTLTSLVCLIGTIQAIVVTCIVEHNPSVWKIGWDINLLTSAYSVRIHIRTFSSIKLGLIIFKFFKFGVNQKS